MGRALIRQVNSANPLIDHWTLGGGTALMLHINHRESRDIDIFLRDPQYLSLLDPEKTDFQFDTPASGSSGDGATFLKFAFDQIGEIDFIVATALTYDSAVQTMIEDEPLFLESVSEIIVKKIYHRGSAIKPRDIFDIAAAAEAHGDPIVRELQRYPEKVSQALSAIEKLNRDFVRNAIRDLAITPAFAIVSGSARERAIEVLRATSR
jgi:Nucleotidyl transferase AbiEii toxin, Type IV TA system